MVFFTTGNIFDSKCEAIVNPVNCVGVMGKGLALQFKNRYPDYFDDYRIQCSFGNINPGSVHIYAAGSKGSDFKYIVNFPTKRHWKDPSLLSDIAEGLSALMYHCVLLKIPSIAIPPLGCGLGGLSWRDVGPLIRDAFDALGFVDADVYGPAPTVSTVTSWPELGRRLS